MIHESKKIQNSVSSETTVKVNFKGFEDVYLYSSPSEMEEILMGHAVTLVICARNKKKVEHYFTSLYKEDGNYKTEFLPDISKAEQYPSLYKMINQLSALSYHKCECLKHVYVRAFFPNKFNRITDPINPLF